MCPPVCIKWLDIRLPVVTGNRLVLLSVATEGKFGLQSVPTDGETISLPALIDGGYSLLPVSTGGKPGLLPQVAGDELAPLVVDSRHVPPLVLIGNRHILLFAAVVDGYVLTSVIAGCKCCLLLA